MMRNYEYILSSLPAIAPEWKFRDGDSFDSIVGWIKTQLGDSDLKTLETLLAGFKDENLSKDFYEAALKDRNRFIREYFSFDLGLRNAKARFLANAFGMPEDKDTIDLPAGDFPEKPKVEEVLSRTDLLEREHGLDSLTWDKISETNTFNYFDMDAILGFVAKLRIISRWSTLDEETGRELFGRLIDEIRGSFGEVQYTAPVK